MKIEENKIGRDFVVGDIHGMYDAFMYELDIVDFDTEKDRVFSVGDLIDRGPDNKKCLELLHHSWFFSVLGNHEDLLVKGPDSMQHYLCHLQNGGEWIRDLHKSELDALIFLAKKEMPVHITLDCRSGRTLGICHAEPPTCDWDDITNESFHEKAMWGRRKIEMGDDEPNIITVRNVTATVHGHTPCFNGIQKIGNSYFIDTGAPFKKGRLTLISVDELFDI